MTIGTFITAGSLVVGTVAAGLAVTFAGLPPDTQDAVSGLGQASAIGAAIAMGAGAIGKGIWAIGHGFSPSTGEVSSPE